MWQAIAGAVLKEGAKADNVAPVNSRSGDTAVDFGGFGGVNFGVADTSSKIALYAAGGVVALVLLFLLVRR